MKIFIVCSKRFYDRIPDIQKELEKQGHVIALPNCYEDPTTEDQYRVRGPEEHALWKGQMFAHSRKVIEENDAVLVLNFDKGDLKHYIGGATFLEIYDAFRFGKKIFLYNDIPEGMLHDEIIGFAPSILHGDLTQI